MNIQLRNSNSQSCELIEQHPKINSKIKLMNQKLKQDISIVLILWTLFNAVQNEQCENNYQNSCLCESDGLTGCSTIHYCVDITASSEKCNAESDNVLIHTLFRSISKFWSGSTLSDCICEPQENHIVIQLKYVKGIHVWQSQLQSYKLKQLLMCKLNKIIIPKSITWNMFQQMLSSTVNDCICGSTALSYCTSTQRCEDNMASSGNCLNICTRNFQINCSCGQNQFSNFNSSNYCSNATANNGYCCDNCTNNIKQSFISGTSTNKDVLVHKDVKIQMQIVVIVFQYLILLIILIILVNEVHLRLLYAHCLLIVLIQGIQQKFAYILYPNLEIKLYLWFHQQSQFVQIQKYIRMPKIKIEIALKNVKPIYKQAVYVVIQQLQLLIQLNIVMIIKNLQVLLKQFYSECSSTTYCSSKQSEFCLGECSLPLSSNCICENKVKQVCSSYEKCEDSYTYILKLFNVWSCKCKIKNKILICNGICNLGTCVQLLKQNCTQCTNRHTYCNKNEYCQIIQLLREFVFKNVSKIKIIVYVEQILLMKLCIILLFIAIKRCLYDRMYFYQLLKLFDTI
ncbi:unnamed protein product [Paramecium primaurelia]|uniref:Transmembrane protein n=1 Tax=Paramecium primaurelia TaxID=5886 RepID=A0A8S1M7T4_PARPR|nr:unnamed protein product [Paramecium primaurelia]